MAVKDFQEMLEEARTSSLFTQGQHIDKDTRGYQ